MKYDLIVVGGGLAGLMSARTAAEDGLKVLLIERKRDITRVNRTCGHLFYISLMNVSGTHKYGYIEPLSLELGTDKTRIHYPGPGFSIDYNGPLMPYFNCIYLSPAGYQVYREKDRFFGFFCHKEALLAGLLSEAEKAGAEVLPETIGLGAENTRDGVKVRVRGKLGEQTLEARKAIAADGTNSRIVESLGLNKGREVLGQAKAVGCILEGVEPEANVPHYCSRLLFAIPSISRGGITMDLYSESAGMNMRHLLGGTEAIIEKFTTHPRYAPWFRHARVVRKTAWGAYQRPTLREPAGGNVLIISDAAIMTGATNPGAIACGYQGAKATLKELNGQKGYLEYIDWWQKAFDTNDNNYRKDASIQFFLNARCSDDDIDYIYSLFQDRMGVPGMLVNDNLELIKEGRPELYERLTKGKR